MATRIEDQLDEIRRALPNRFTISASIGGGGQGGVFRGTVDGHDAALKVFDPQQEPRRVERELHLLTKIDCPHLVKVLAVDHVMIGGVAFPLVAYELHPGGDLTKLLRPSVAPISPQELVRIGHEVGIAVDELWARRIVHRDIKPANIVQAADGRYVLVDVGLARHLDRSALTAAGLVPGTRGYMSPEQASGRSNLTVHSDIFSLGVTLYEIGAKAHPFERDQNRIVARMAARGLHTVRPSLPRNVAAAIDQMIALRPSMRPRSAAGHFKPLLGT